MSEQDEGAKPPAPNGAGQAAPRRTVRRFKDFDKGRGGRPKGSPNRKTIVRKVANKTLTVMENGKRKRRTVLELVLLALRNLALEQKKARAFDEYHRLLETHQPQQVDETLGYLVVPAEISPEDWIAREMRDNAKRVDPRIRYRDDEARAAAEAARKTDPSG